MRRYRAFAALLCAATLAACSGNGVQDITGALPAAQVKFFNFAPNSPSVNFWANDVKMTAVSSTKIDTESTLGTAYGKVAAGGYYTGIAAGQYTLTGKITATTDQGLAISNLQASLEAGKLYSYYLSGIYDGTAKTAESFIVEDPVPAQFDYSKAYVRFVNAISNANPMILYAKNDSSTIEGPVGDAVAYKAAGTFTAMDAGVYDLNTRYPGSGTNVITRTGVSFVAGQVYTIGARGDITAGSGASKPALDNTANR